jgi:hypothetical protein
MDISAAQLEVKVETNMSQTEQASTADALMELSSIELAYVGGGTASVSFI